MRGVSGLAALALAGLLAGCGSTVATHRSAGRTLFVRECGFCHSLTGKQSPRRQGGDLVGFHMTRTAMLQFVREMPVPDPLSSEELRAVADYVLSVEAAGRGAR